jgi:lysozyme
MNRYVKPTATVAGALLASLVIWEGYSNIPRPVIENKTDSQWCAGITGIPAQDYYTDADCDRLISGHLVKDVAALDRCLPMDKLPERIQFAARHIAYNTGPALVCKSSMAKAWRAGDVSPASCHMILRYTFVAGKDCRLTGPRCPGVVKRRTYEHGTCNGTIDWREQAWDYRP